MKLPPGDSYTQNKDTAANVWRLTDLRVFLSLAVLLMSGSAPQAGSIPRQVVAIPSQADWVDCGTIFVAGAEGEWDTYLWGGFANGVVKQGDTTFLYYQGANGYDDDEETVTWRAIGVATSPDGINFTKAASNPVLTWFPGNQLEEGAVSSGVYIDENSEIAIYYGANTWVGGSLVTADARLATSPDGFAFTDQGIVLDHTDSSIWGAGDELFPVIGLQEGGRWVAYYIPNGTPQAGQLGVAWGERRDALINSAAAQGESGPVAVWGSASAVRLEEGVYALFLNNVRATGGPVIEVRTVSISAPERLSEPVQRYQFADVQQATVLRDAEAKRWMMYYRSADGGRYGVKAAPAAGQSSPCQNPPGPTIPLPTPLPIPFPTSTTTVSPLDTPSPPSKVFLPLLSHRGSISPEMGFHAELQANLDKKPTEKASHSYV